MNVYVGNLPYDVTEADLQAALRLWGGGVGPHHHGPIERSIEGLRLRRNALGV
jgi:hypothetical protein